MRPSYLRAASSWLYDSITAELYRWCAATVLAAVLAAFFLTLTASWSSINGPMDLVFVLRAVALTTFIRILTATGIIT